MSDSEASGSGSSSPVIIKQQASVKSEELELVKNLLLEVKNGLNSVKDGVSSWKERSKKTTELSYPSGISLLSLKNHLLLSYLHHLLAIFSLKLSSRSLSKEGKVEGAGGGDIVQTLVKLRIVLEKLGPLEGKLKYQIEKLVRKADAADEGEEEDVANDPLAFRPNPSNLMMDRNDSGEEEDENEIDDYDLNKAGIYRPPRVAAMPYTEGPTKGKKAKRVLPSHMISDLSTSLSSSTPYGESTSGLSVTIDPSLSSGTARHLKQLIEYEESTLSRARVSKKESKQRRNEEEEVAFGGLGSGKGGKRRLGGFGAELDDLLGDMNSSRTEGAYAQMRGMKRVKVNSGPIAGEKDDTKGTSGLAGLNEGSKGKGKNKFDRAVVRAGKGSKGQKRTGA